MNGRKIKAKWTGRVQRGSAVRKLTRHRKVPRIAGSPPQAGRRMTPDEAVQFALDKYKIALNRLAQTD